MDGDNRFKLFWDSKGLFNLSSGIGHYAQRLEEGLGEFRVQPLRLVAKQDHRAALANEKLFRTRLIAAPQSRVKLLWPQIVGSHLLKTCQDSGPHIYHAFDNFNLPYSSGFHAKFQSVLNVMDLIPLRQPRQVSWALRQQLKWYLPRILPKVKKIICISEWSRQDLVANYPYVVDKTVTIYPGFPELQMPVNLEVSMETLPHFLFISRYEKYKNFDLLVKILQKAKDKIHLSVLTDSAGRAFLDSNLGLGQCKHLSVYSGLSDSQLENLFYSCDVYLHTSRYEGFCLPACEALAHGLPVVYMAGSGIDEVVSQGLGVGLPSSAPVDDWIQAALETVTLKTKTEFRKTVEQKAIEIGSWQMTARKVLGIYRSLLK